MVKKDKRPKIKVIYNGLMWSIEVSRKFGEYMGIPQLIAETLAVSEDFREIKAALEEMGLSRFDPQIGYEFRCCDPFPLVPSVLEGPFTGSLDCLIPRPIKRNEIPEGVDIGGLIYLSYFSDETGGFYCTPDQLEAIGIGLWKFKRAWPR